MAPENAVTAEGRVAPCPAGHTSTLRPTDLSGGHTLETGHKDKRGGQGRPGGSSSHVLHMASCGVTGSRPARAERVRAGRGVPAGPRKHVPSPHWVPTPPARMLHEVTPDGEEAQGPGTLGGPAPHLGPPPGLRL